MVSCGFPIHGVAADTDGALVVLPGRPAPRRRGHQRDRTVPSRRHTETSSGKVCRALTADLVATGAGNASATEARLQRATSDDPPAVKPVPHEFLQTRHIV